MFSIPSYSKILLLVSPAESLFCLTREAERENERELNEKFRCIDCLCQPPSSIGNQGKPDCCTEWPRNGERGQCESFVFIPLFKITILQDPALCEGAFTQLSGCDGDFCFSLMFGSFIRKQGWKWVCEVRPSPTFKFQFFSYEFGIFHAEVMVPTRKIMVPTRSYNLGRGGEVDQK